MNNFLRRQLIIQELYKRKIATAENEAAEIYNMTTEDLEKELEKLEGEK